MKGKWIIKVDISSAIKWYLLLVAYFLFIVVFINFYSVISVGNLIGTSLYRYLQFYPSIIIIMLTADMFEETFRKGTKMYLHSFGLSVFQTILSRLIRLFFSIAILYVPLIIYSISQFNYSLAAFYHMFPNTAVFPMVGYMVPLFHCLVIALFSIVTTLFIMFILESKSIAIMLLFSFLAFDVLVSRNYFQPYNIFRGAFDPPELYDSLPPHINIAITAIIAFLCILCLRYRASK